MAKRKRLSMKKSKRLFTRTAKRVNRKNGLAGAKVAMRGGIRL